jgi:hypothetical protein
MTTFLIIYLILGLIAAPLSYGMTLAYWWNESPILKSEVKAAGCIAVAVFLACYAVVLPPAAIVIYFLSNRARHGLLFRNPSKYL